MRGPRSLRRLEIPHLRRSPDAYTTRAGDAFIALGTSGVLWATTDQFRPNPASAVHAFCHAIPGVWRQMAVMLSAASCLAWWSGVIGVSEADLLGSLGDNPVAPSPVLFHPYLSGERTPHNNPALRGAFHGLSHETTRDALTRAVLDGVAFAFRDGLDPLRAAGTTINAADVIGGGARSRFWIATLANVLDIPLHHLADTETGGAVGAARLARIAATGEALVTVCKPPKRLETIAPDPAIAARYAEARTRWIEARPGRATASPCA